MQELYHHCRHLSFRWCSPTTSRRFPVFSKRRRKEKVTPLFQHKRLPLTNTPVPDGDQRASTFGSGFEKVSLGLDLSLPRGTNVCAARPHHISQFFFQAVHQKLFNSFHYVVEPIYPSTKISFLWHHRQRLTNNNFSALE